jgi:hypothetical protein
MTGPRNRLSKKLDEELLPQGDAATLALEQEMALEEAERERDADDDSDADSFENWFGAWPY